MENFTEEHEQMEKDADMMISKLVADNYGNEGKRKEMVATLMSLMSMSDPEAKAKCRKLFKYLGDMMSDYNMETETPEEAEEMEVMSPYSESVYTSVFNEAEEEKESDEEDSEEKPSKDESPEKEEDKEEEKKEESTVRYQSVFAEKTPVKEQKMKKMMLPVMVPVENDEEEYDYNDESEMKYSDSDGAYIFQGHLKKP